MSLDPSYLQYPKRRRGMDHDRYPFSMLHERPPLRWPGGKPLAISIVVAVEHFPLNQQGKPFKVPGGMTTAYPDLRHYSLRDYGNRVGIWRVLRALDAAGLPSSFAINAAVIDRYPTLARTLAARGDELIAHGLHMDALHHQGLGENTERDWIESARDALAAIGPEPRGWLSPAKQQSALTPDLLHEAGFAYMLDWVNDELPYRFSTRKGSITAIPLSTELEDRFVMLNNLHSEQSWVTQVSDAIDWLGSEASPSSPRLLMLLVHAWVVGQAHRIAAFETLLARIARAGACLLAPSAVAAAGAKS